jgi:DNA replication protein DnaC
VFDIESVCPRCYKSSIVQSEQEGNGYQVSKLCEKCTAAIKAHWIQQIDSRGMEYQKFSFEGFEISKDNQKSVDVCKQFAESKLTRFGLWLFSPNTGNGKTHLSFATLKHWIDKTYIPKVARMEDDPRSPYAYSNENDLLLRIRATYKNGSNEEDESDVVDEFKNAEFVILDDLGKTNASDLSFMQRTFYTIIDYRYLRHKLTIVTSNKNGAELQQYLGLYTFDRLRGMSEKVTEIHGESYRGKK